MKKKVRLTLILLLGVVFLGSAAVLLRQMLQYRAGAEIYSEAEALAGLPDFSAPEEPDAPDGSSAGTATYIDPYADAMSAMDFSALREVNGDVLGWIMIPGTKISYPVLQAEDNQYYLNRTWKKVSSVVGAVFLEHTNSADFSDFNSIIYGHRMNDGSMFAGLKYYKKQSYWKSHPTVYLTDDNGTRAYQIFAAYEVSTQGETYRLGQQSDKSKQKYIAYSMGQSLYETGVVPTVNDRILTLSTCTGRGHATRWVVQARLQGQPIELSTETVETPAEAPIEAPTEAPTEP